MPNLNVCTGPAFTTGSRGELIVAGSNSNAWPFGVPIGANNGLNTDPVNGLWTAPHGCYRMFSKQGQTSLSATVTAGNGWYAPAAAVAVVNPSNAARARLMTRVTFRLGVSVPQDSLCLHQGQVGYASPSFNNLGTVGQSAPGTWGISDTRTDGDATVVNAGATATLTLGQAIYVIAGSITVTSWELDIETLAILLDPTQAGGIS